MTTPHATPRPAADTARNAGIDLLRGGAILLVVVHHLALRFRLPLGPSWLGDWLPKRAINAISFNGYESVFVFFVVSGFLITQRTLHRHGALQRMDWRLFYRLRAGRILPLLGLLLAMLVAMHALGVPGFVVAEHGQTLGGALLSALTMTLNWYEGQTGWLPGAWDVLWSLSIEESFYLAFPLLCLWLPPRALVAGLVVLAASLPFTHAALAGNEIWQEKAYLPGMSAIACGVLAAWLARRWVPSPRSARVLGLVGAAGVFAVFVYGDVVWRLLHDGSLLLLCLSAAALVLAAQAGPRSAPRGTGWLARMGGLSYEIYLSHMFVVLGATAAYQQVLGADLRWTVLAYPPVLALCVLLGAGLEGLVSRPALRWWCSGRGGTALAGYSAASQPPPGG